MPTSFALRVKAIPARFVNRTIGRLTDARFGFPRTASRVIRSAELGVDALGGIGYEPSPWHTLRRILPVTEVTRDDVFLDLGTGAGRILFQAASYPFARVIGVEVVPQLLEIARRTIDRNRSRFRCGEIELVGGDARTYEIPDDVTVLYLYQPFGQELFDRVIRNVFASVDRRPRTIGLIYAAPNFEDRLLATGRARFVRYWKRGWPSGRPRGFVRLYELR